MSTPKHTFLIPTDYKNPLKKLKGKLNFFVKKKGFKSTQKDYLQENKKNTINLKSQKFQN